MNEYTTTVVFQIVQEVTTRATDLVNLLASNAGELIESEDSINLIDVNVI